MNWFHRSIKQVADSSGAVAQASEQLSSASDQLSAGSQQQASSLEETAATVRPTATKALSRSISERMGTSVLFQARRDNPALKRTRDVTMFRTT